MARAPRRSEWNLDWQGCPIRITRTREGRHVQLRLLLDGHMADRETITLPALKRTAVLTASLFVDGNEHHIDVQVALSENSSQCEVLVDGQKINVEQAPSHEVRRNQRKRWQRKLARLMRWSGGLAATAVGIFWVSRPECSVVCAMVSLALLSALWFYLLRANGERGRMLY